MRLGWAKEEVKKMNEAEKEETPSFSIELNAGTELTMNDQRCFNGGYLFLQDIYYELGVDKICTAIRTRHDFDYNLKSILSRLLYTRILYPSSKLSAYKESQGFLLIATEYSILIQRKKEHVISSPPSL